MKQKLLNSFKLKATLFVALLCAVCTGAWADPTEKTESWTFNGSDTWTSGLSLYCGLYGSKSAATTVKNAAIANFSSVDFSTVLSPSVTITVNGLTNSGTNSYTVSLVDKDGNDIGTPVTATDKLGKGTNSGSAKESSVVLTPVAGTTGYRITVPAKGALKGTSYTLTYTIPDIPTFTLSAESNNTTYGTVSVENNVITASPAEGCRVSKTTPYEVTSGEIYVTNVAQSGNVFTVTATDDCTIQINFEAIPTYTITYSENGETRNATLLEGAAIDFSDPASVPSGYVFVGWATETISGTQATAPSLVTEATASGDATYYAVYAEEAEGAVTATFDADDLTATPAVSGESLTWKDTGTGITLKVSEGQFYTGSPKTFTVTAGTTHYFEVTTTGSLTSVVGTFTGSNYSIGSVSTGTLSTNNTTSTVNSFTNASSVKCYAKSSYQIRARTIVVNAVQTVLENYCTTISSKPKAVITLSASDIAMVWGDTDKVLTATLTVGGESSAEALTFTSSSSDLTRASNGTLSCDEPGDYTITVSIAETETHQSAQAVCNVTVNKKDADLSFAEIAVDGLLGEDFDAPALTNSYSAPVAYSSSTTATATVDPSSGVVTLVAKGTTTITATATGKYEGSASYTITVIDPNEKGTEYNPYTVADLIAMGDTPATTENVYVRGWVVGYMKSGPTLSTTYSDFTVSNIALADNSDETDVSKAIAIQLTKNSARASLNLMDCPYNLNVAQYTLVGKIGKAFGKMGLTTTLVASKKTAEKITITSAGYATKASDASLDFSKSSIKAYYATVNGDNKGVTFHQVDQVPANTGVLLYSASGATTEVIPVLASAADVDDNVFVPVLETINELASTDGDLHNYILNNVGGVIGFYQAAGKKVAAGKAYIQVDKSTSVKSFIALPGFEDETGVNDIVNGQSINGKWYNLAGQRVNKAQKGIFIVNGKKVVK